MSKQLEPGVQTPMRPTIQTFELGAGDFALIQQFPALDWTLAGTKVPLTLKTKMMDDENRFSAVGVAGTVREGIYELEFTATLINASVTVEKCRMAITNGPGTTIHVEGPDFVIPAGGQETATLKAVVHLTAIGGNVINFRAAQRTDGTDITVNAAYVGFWRKIGNVNES